MTGRRQRRRFGKGRSLWVGLNLAAVVLPLVPARATSLKALVGSAAGYHNVAAVILIIVIGGIGVFFGLLL